MRFLRGLLLGILFFVIMQFSDFIIIGNFVEVDENFDVFVRDFSFEDAMQEIPIWTIIFLLSLFGMFIGPLYYWILEPILKKRREAKPYEP